MGTLVPVGFSPSLSHWALLPLPPDWKAMVTLHCVCLENLLILSVDVYFSLWDGVCFLLSFSAFYTREAVCGSIWIFRECMHF